MRTYVISCAVLAIDMKHVAERFGLEMNFIFLEGGLHDRPDTLNTKLQETITSVSAQKDCQQIIIGYGVCGRGIIGIRAANVPLIVPKVHDCIALFLGGDDVYRSQFERYPGTYYISAGWYDENTRPQSQQKKWVNYGAEQLNYDRLREQYGSVTADTTFQFLNSWQSNYQRAAFIDTGVKKSPRYESHAKKLATENGWKYEKIHGNLQLIEALLTENVSNDQILVVPPEHTIGFDPMKSTLSANPLYSERDIVNELPWKDIVDGDEQETGDSYTIGLGIDAGGTYTDIVVYDLLHSKTLGKTKALTTKWDFTKGISQALSGLDAEQLKHVQLVALSTTLATNAIVEGNGQKVGLILMPPP